MKITRENQNNGSALIKVVVEQKDYEKNVADKLREYRQKASLPGFRPGKVPAHLILKRFAKPILAEEVNNLLTNGLTNYLKDEKISILGDPLPDVDGQQKINWDTDTEFEFAFDVGLAPEIKVHLDHSLAYDYYRIKVDEPMLAESMESVRSRYGINQPADSISEKSSVRGDFVQLDGDGKPVENGIAPSGVMIAVELVKDEAIRNSIIGRSRGDVIIFNPVTAFENHHEVGHMLNISHEAAETLESDFSFTVTEIFDFQQAELNDELFKRIYGPETDITTVEAFKQQLTSEISQNLSYSSDQKFANDAKENLINGIYFELPEAFLKRWLKEVNKEMTDEQLESEFPAFTRDLRWQLIKNSIIRDYDLKIAEEEIAAYARQIAVSQFQQYGLYQVQEEHLDNYVKKILEKEEDKERIIRRIYDHKVISLVRENVAVVEKEVTSDEFSAMVNRNREPEQ